MDFCGPWFQPGSFFVRSRSTVAGDALSIGADAANADNNELIDQLALEMTRVGIHEHRFEHVERLKFLVEVIVDLSRYFHITNSLGAIEVLGKGQDGFFDEQKLMLLLQRIVGWAAKRTSVVMNAEILGRRLRFCATTVARGGGGYGTHSLSVSQAPEVHEQSPPPREPERPAPQPQPQPQPEPQPQHTQGNESSQVASLREQVDSLSLRLQQQSSVLQSQQSDAVLELLAEKNSVWVATDDPNRTKDFGPFASLLSAIPPMKVINERKGELLTALGMMASFMATSEIASGDRRQWLKYASRQSGRKLDADDIAAIHSGPLVETLIILLRMTYEGSLEAASKGGPKAYPYHNLVRFGRIVYRASPISVDVFKEVWSGKDANIVLDGSMVVFRLNH